MITMPMKNGEKFSECVRKSSNDRRCAWASLGAQAHCSMLLYAARRFLRSRSCVHRTWILSVSFSCTLNAETNAADIFLSDLVFFCERKTRFWRFRAQKWNRKKILENYWVSDGFLENWMDCVEEHWNAFSLEFDDNQKSAKFGFFSKLCSVPFTNPVNNVNPKYLKRLK